MSFAQQLAASRVLPVVTARSVDGAVRTAAALADGGISIVEITLRTPCALEAIAAVRAEVPEIAVAAGTVLRPGDVAQAVEAGAAFCVSPGISEALLSFCDEEAIPFLPGVANASDVMLGLAHGRTVFKLFPAVPAGGIPLLRALAGPFPDVRFCPTGGLDASNFRDFLALPNVICCGGSWMVGAELVENERWEQIETLARQALA